MKAEAGKLNAELVFNVKLETTRIATGRAGAIEVLAYGTAMLPVDAGHASGVKPAAANDSSDNSNTPVAGQPAAASSTLRR